MFRRVKLQDGPDAGKWQIADVDGKAMAGYGTFDTEDEVITKQHELNGTKPKPKNESLMRDVCDMVCGKEWMGRQSGE